MNVDLSNSGASHRGDCGHCGAGVWTNQPRERRGDVYFHEACAAARDRKDSSDTAAKHGVTPKRTACGQNNGNQIAEGVQPHPQKPLESCELSGFDDAVTLLNTTLNSTRMIADPQLPTVRFTDDTDDRGDCGACRMPVSTDQLDNVNGGALDDKPCPNPSVVDGMRAPGTASAASRQELETIRRDLKQIREVLIQERKTEPCSTAVSGSENNLSAVLSSSPSRRAYSDLVQVCSILSSPETPRVSSVFTSDPPTADPYLRSETDLESTFDSGTSGLSEENLAVEGDHSDILGDIIPRHFLKGVRERDHAQDAAVHSVYKNTTVEDYLNLVLEVQKSTTTAPQEPGTVEQADSSSSSTTMSLTNSFGISDRKIQATAGLTPPGALQQNAVLISERKNADVLRDEAQTMALSALQSMMHQIQENESALSDDDLARALEEVGKITTMIHADRERLSSNLDVAKQDLEKMKELALLACREAGSIVKCAKEQARRRNQAKKAARNESKILREKNLVLVNTCTRLAKEGELLTVECNKAQEQKEEIKSRAFEKLEKIAGMLNLISILEAPFRHWITVVHNARLEEVVKTSDQVLHECALKCVQTQEEMRGQQESLRQEMLQQYAQEIQSLRQEHLLEVSALREEHNNHILRSKAEHEQNTRALKNEIDELRAVLSKKMESIAYRLMRNSIAEAPFKTWANLTNHSKRLSRLQRKLDLRLVTLSLSRSFLGWTRLSFDCNLKQVDRPSSFSCVPVSTSLIKDGGSQQQSEMTPPRALISSAQTLEACEISASPVCRILDVMSDHAIALADSGNEAVGSSKLSIVAEPSSHVLPLTPPRMEGLSQRPTVMRTPSACRSSSGSSLSSIHVEARSSQDRKHGERKHSAALAAAAATTSFTLPAHFFASMACNYATPASVETSCLAKSSPLSAASLQSPVSEINANMNMSSDSVGISGNSAAPSVGSSTAAWLASKSVGIGAYFRRSDTHPDDLEVKSIVPNSPAAVCGKIHLGDIIVAVDGEPTHGQSMTQLASKLLGTHESKVECSFQKKHTDEVYIVSLVRGTAAPCSVRADADGKQQTDRNSTKE